MLSAVNQGAVVIGGGATVGSWLGVAGNNAVPFVVASVGYLSARLTCGVPASDGPQPKDR